MNTRRNRRVLAAVVVMIVTGIVVNVQSDQAGDGEWISFPNTTVGQTQTTQFTYTLLETSATAALVTVSTPAPPFGVEGPLSFTLNPGQSRTLDVTFSPTEVGDYEGSFSVSALGGFPPQIKTTYVTLTGQGVATSGDQADAPTFSWVFPPISTPTEPTQTTDTSDEDLAKVEAKLDAYGPAITDLRQRLDNLGWWLGRLTNGAPLGLGPHDTNPMPQTNTWEQLAMLEAKLDYLFLEQPSEITIIEVYDIIVEINILIVQINQWVINLGGNVAGLEAKLDQLQFDIDDIYDGIFGIPGGVLDLLDGVGGVLDLLDGVGGVLDLLDGVGGVLDLLDGVGGVLDLLDGVGGVLDLLEGPGGVLALLNDPVNGLVALGKLLNDPVNGLVALGKLLNDNGAAIAANAGGIAANGVAIGANAGAIAANAAALRALQDSNNRIEDMLKQQQGYPAAPTASKITLKMGGGPLPSVPWSATVEGSAGAVQANAMVTIYWPIALPPNTVTADANGAFSFTISTGNIMYFSVDVTQTLGGLESARVSIPAS